MNGEKTSRLEHERERDFERRWSHAGASPEELNGIRGGLSAEAPAKKRRLDRAWRSIERRATARQNRDWRSLAMAAVAGATLAGTAVFMLRPAAEPKSLEIEGGSIGLSADAVMTRKASGELVLERGTAYVEIEARPSSSSPVRFRAADLALGVVEETGSVFALRVEADRGLVRVYDGAVIAAPQQTAPVRVDRTSGIVPIAGAWDPALLGRTDRWGEDAARRHHAEATRPVEAAEAPAVHAEPPRPHEEESAQPSEPVEPRGASPEVASGPDRTYGGTQDVRREPRPHHRRTSRAIDRRVHRTIDQARTEEQVTAPVEREAEKAPETQKEAPSASIPAEADTPEIPKLDPNPTGGHRMPSNEELRRAAAASRVRTLSAPLPEPPKSPTPPTAEIRAPEQADGIEKLERLKERLPPERRPEIALYVQALQALRKGRAFDAALTFQKYLDLYPEGILHDEAELSRLEALFTSKAWDVFRREAEGWLSAHPKHHRRGEIERLLSDLH